MILRRFLLAILLTLVLVATFIYLPPNAESVFSLLTSLFEWLDDKSGLLMVLVTITYVWFTFRALNISRQSVDAVENSLVGTMRPWLSLELGLTGNFKIKDDCARVPVAVRVKNHGKSPAIRAHLNIKLLSGFPPTFHEELKRMADNREKGRTPKLDGNLKVFGDTIFPDQQVQNNYNAALSLQDVEGLLSGEREHFGIDIIAEIKYESAYDNQVYQTLSYAKLYRVIPEGGRNMFNLEDKDLDRTQYSLVKVPLMGGDAF